MWVSFCAEAVDPQEEVKFQVQVQVSVNVLAGIVYFQM